MKQLRNVATFILLLVSGLIFFACEFEEPFPNPHADFKVWITDPETNERSQIPEPITLTRGVKYDFEVEGSGQQFVFWFGLPGKPEANKPSGSNFNDRGKNHLSKGIVLVEMKHKFSYSEAGTYEIVLVASSYKYSTDEYTESLTKKTVNVTEPE